MRWPMPTVKKSRCVPIKGARRFGAAREGTRRHCGIDLRPMTTESIEGEDVIAPISGLVRRIQSWSGPGTRAIVLNGMLGPIPVSFVMGAVAKPSVKQGDIVRAGEKIAEIGVYPSGSTMLHMEMYVGRWIDKNSRWFGDDKPIGLVDPSKYLWMMRK